MDLNKEKCKNDSKPATFEEAIEAAGFGKFNLWLMFVNVFSEVAQVAEVMSLPYVVPVAQCDLDLALEDKGLLIATSFAGMIASGFFWGYLCDMFGRKRVIVYGYFLESIIALLTAFSPNKITLMVWKFLGGLIINGPFSAATSHLSEFHASKLRARVQIFRGIILSSGTILLTLLAWAILPNVKDFLVFGYVIHSWNVFLLICALFPILSGVLYIFVPESPKFLMSNRQNSEAMAVFQQVYSMNKGEPSDTYPIKSLVEEAKPVENGSKESLISEGFSQIKLLALPPYVWKILLTGFVTAAMHMSVNTIRLWLPQILQTINDYQHLHKSKSSSLCVILRDLAHPKNVSGNCTVNLDNTHVYTHSTVVGLSNIATYLAAATMVNLLGTKMLLFGLFFSSGCFSIILYLASNLITVTALASVSMALGSVGENILCTVTMELFPTNLRAKALSLFFTFGRIASSTGNIVFPYLLYAGCSLPFYFVGALAFISAFSSLFLPNIKNKPLL